MTGSELHSWVLRELEPLAESALDTMRTAMDRTLVDHDNDDAKRDFLIAVGRHGAARDAIGIALTLVESMLREERTRAEATYL